MGQDLLIHRHSNSNSAQCSAHKNQQQECNNKANPLPLMPNHNQMSCPNMLHSEAIARRPCRPRGYMVMRLGMD